LVSTEGIFKKINRLVKAIFSFPILFSCQPELLEGGTILKKLLTLNCLRQAANDMYFKALTFKPLGCQPEPVEGGFLP
jgi:hypothetical protein